MDDADQRAAASPGGGRRITEPGPGSLDDGAMEQTAALSSQERVGRYVIQHFLAEGGMGVVYAAFDPELGRHVAVKLVKKRGGGDGHLRERLLREAQALAQLSHPNVVAIHDVGLHDDRVFLAMELVEGVSLRGWMELPRRWKDALAVLMAAGRGLAAAHSAGIVHRDFKPDNVIVGNDGRVCVLDFGLARAVDGVDTEPGAAAVPVASSDPDEIATAILAPAPVVGTIDGRERLERNLTRLGTVMGTPAYMSPEHHRGEPVTSLSDQYSFCVAAWEALYRQRPFSSQGDLLGEKEKQRLAPPPRRSEVPARIRRVLLRGLSPEPAARHASMAQLLAELERTLRAPRRWAIAGLSVSGALVVAAGTMALAWRATGPDTCTRAQAGARLRPAWNEVISTKLARAFGATERPQAAATAGRVRSALQRYGDEWAAMHADSCAATHVRHEQSAALLDLRTQCLEQRRDALRALAALLSKVRASDGATVDRAVEAALELPAIRACADAPSLRAVVPLPAEPARREAIAAARGALGDVKALMATGQYALALPWSKEVVAKARPLRYPPLLAAALVVQTRLEQELGQLEPSLLSAREGVKVAGASHDDSQLVESLVTLMWSLGHLARYDEALAIGTAAEAIAVRTATASSPEGNDGLRATLVGAMGRLLTEQGKLEQGARTLAEAVALREREVGPQGWQLAVGLNNLGEALRAMGRNDEARAQYQRALAVTEQALGANHPNAGAILNNLATVLESESKYDEARVLYERSLRIDEETFGQQHSRVAISLLNLGALEDSMGRMEDAIPIYERALAIQRKALGDKHPDVGMVLHNLGQAFSGLGKHEEALARSREALAIFEAALAPDHVYLGPPLTGIGEALLALGRAGEAMPYYERALAIQRKALDEDAQDLAPTLHGIGAVNLRLGRAAAAVAPSEREVALYEKNHGEARGWAEAEAQLAQALWGSGGDHRRAAALAHSALARLGGEKIGNEAAAAQLRKQIERWLRKHRAK